MNNCVDYSCAFAKSLVFGSLLYCRAQGYSNYICDNSVLIDYSYRVMVSWPELKRGC